MRPPMVNSRNAARTLQMPCRIHAETVQTLPPRNPSFLYPQTPGLRRVTSPGTSGGLLVWNPPWRALEAARLEAKGVMSRKGVASERRSIVRSAVHRTHANQHPLDI